jgi:ABC-2 type transport system permease protein
MAFVRNCLRQAVEFRANFFVNMFTNFAWVFSLLIFLGIIYNNTQSVAGWTKGEMFILFGTYSVLRGVSNSLFYNNLSQIPTTVRMGTMDFVLTKPVNSQFYVSLRYIALEDLGQTAGGLLVMVLGWSQLHHSPPAASSVLAYSLMLLMGLVIFYSLNLLLMTLSFWLVRLDNLMVLADTVFGIARTPIDIFGAFGKIPVLALTYVLPLAFLAAMPVAALFGKINPMTGVLESSAIAGFLLTCSTLFWAKATRSYSSASS